MNNRKSIKQILIGILGIVTFNTCSTIPKGVTAVTSFDKEKYLGRWYEIARFDFIFERNLNNTTAQYSINTDGSICVVNRGYNYKTKQWKEAKGKAKFIGDETVAMLKVSFFGPFYSGYNVIAIDNNYSYALVSGKNTDYLWILSRETTIPETIKQNFITLAEKLGYKTSNLVWVEHDKK